MISPAGKELLSEFVHDCIAYLRFALSDMWHHAHFEILLPLLVMGVVILGIFWQWKMENQSRSN